MPATTCPFCGIVTDVAHETQQACIEALQAEIARTKGILDHSQRIGAKPSSPDGRPSAEKKAETGQ
jgi:hypothetical protein